MTTTARLLRLLSLLQARRDWPGAVLAERLGISHRTVRRDVERLRELGYSIRSTMGPDGGYRLDAGSELPPLLFDDDQVVALAVALGNATAAGADIDEAAARALATISQVMPSRLRHRLAALEFTAVPADTGAPQPVPPDRLMALSTAVRAREVLRFDYGSTVDDVPGPPRRAEPHRLVASRGRWYLLAWDLDRDDWRVFRADRIRPRIPNGPRFTPRDVPGGDVGELIAARFKGAERGNAWPCTGTVILARPAAEVLPFVGDGLLEPLGPERCRLELGSWSWVALAASLGRFDADVEVVGPVELTDAFSVLAARNASSAGREPRRRRPGPRPR
ncbi:MAG: helix-turn-helix transcriptional regulator [Actinomycetota bacterium]